MADGAHAARKALSRGNADEALVLLWNDVERARLAGDRRALATTERLARQIARHGDASQRQDAERLLEALGRVAEAEAAAAPAVARVEPHAPPVTGDAGGLDTARGEFPEAEAETEAEAQLQTGRRLGTILWLLFIIAVVIVNILNRGGG